MSLKTKIKILVIILTAGIILAGGWLIRESRQMAKEVFIATDKIEYQTEGALRIKIKNNLAENICFSSCYPYYLEKNGSLQGGGWQSYSYSKCDEPDIVEKCIELFKTKAFEIILTFTEPGLHRIAIPVCVGCQEGEGFREDKRLYSNQFRIQEKPEATTGLRLRHSVSLIR